MRDERSTSGGWQGGGRGATSVSSTTRYRIKWDCCVGFSTTPAASRKHETASACWRPSAGLCTSRRRWGSRGRDPKRQGTELSSSQQHFRRHSGLCTAELSLSCAAGNELGCQRRRCFPPAQWLVRRPATSPLSFKFEAFGHGMALARIVASFDLARANPIRSEGTVCGCHAAERATD